MIVVYLFEKIGLCINQKFSFTSSHVCSPPPRLSTSAASRSEGAALPMEIWSEDLKIQNTKKNRFYHFKWVSPLYQFFAEEPPEEFSQLDESSSWPSRIRLWKWWKNRLHEEQRLSSFSRVKICHLNHYKYISNTLLCLILHVCIYMFKLYITHLVFV